MERGRVDAHSGLSGHVFTVYKDIRAWQGATPGAAIHQSCDSPSQHHHESPPPPPPPHHLHHPLGSELEADYLPTKCISFSFLFFLRRNYFTVCFSPPHLYYELRVKSFKEVK